MGLLIYTRPTSALPKPCRQRHHELVFLGLQSFLLSLLSVAKSVASNRSSPKSATQIKCIRESLLEHCQSDQGLWQSTMRLQRSHMLGWRGTLYSAHSTPQQIRAYIFSCRYGGSQWGPLPCPCPTLLL